MSLTSQAISEQEAETARVWVVRLGSGEITTQELMVLRAWLESNVGHRQAFERERAMWQDADLLERELRSPKPSSTPFRRIAGPRLRRRPDRAAVAMAACLAAIVTGTMAMMTKPDHITEAGETRRVALPDGSVAVLDTDSALNIDFNNQERRVSLVRGRAWFDVDHGDPRPFRVAARDSITQDIGTAFAVAIDETEVSVSMSEGAAILSSEANPEAGVVLRTGQTARKKKGAHPERVSDVPVDLVAPWRHEMMILTDAPLDEAIRETARYRRGAVWLFGDLSDAAPVSGVFRTDSSDDALKTLAAMRGLALVHLPAGVIIVHAGA